MSTVPTPAPACQVPDDILPAYLPGGGISILAGAPNLGKTALLAGLLRDLAQQRPVFGMTARPVAIGFVNTDRGWDRGAGMWLTRVGLQLPHYSLSDDPTFKPKILRRKPDRTEILGGLIDRLALPPDSLIVVDPISLFLGGNLLDYDACAVAAHEIRAYLRRKQYTMLCTAHSGKMKADKSDRYVRTSDQILGSTAIPGFTDAVLHLASPEELNRAYYQLTWHPHGAKAQVHRLERDEQGLFVPYTGADRANMARVLALVPEDGDVIAFAAILELAQAIPLSRRTVKSLLDELIERGTIERAGHGQYRRITLQ